MSGKWSLHYLVKNGDDLFLENKTKLAEFLWMRRLNGSSNNYNAMKQHTDVLEMFNLFKKGWIIKYTPGQL